MSGTDVCLNCASKMFAGYRPPTQNVVLNTAPLLPPGYPDWEQIANSKSELKESYLRQGFVPPPGRSGEPDPLPTMTHNESPILRLPVI